MDCNLFKDGLCTLIAKKFGHIPSATEKLCLLPAKVSLKKYWWLSLIFNFVFSFTLKTKRVIMSPVHRGQSTALQGSTLLSDVSKVLQCLAGNNVDGPRRTDHGSSCKKSQSAVSDHAISSIKITCRWWNEFGSSAH